MWMEGKYFSNFETLHRLRWSWCTDNSPWCPVLTPSSCSILTSMIFNRSPWRSFQRTFICQFDYMTLEAHFINWNNSSNSWHLCLKWSSVTKFWNPKEAYLGSTDYSLPGVSKRQELNFCSSGIKGHREHLTICYPGMGPGYQQILERFYSDIPLSAWKLGLLKRKTTAFGHSPAPPHTHIP